MPLSGTIDLGLLGFDGTGTGVWYIKGEDGNHYVTVGTSAIKVARAEDLTIIWSQSHDDWLADLATVNPSGYTGIPSDYSPIGLIWPIVGTSKFYVPGNRGGEQAILLRYNIDATGTVVLDGGAIFTTTGHEEPGTYISNGFLFGAGSFGSYVYFVIWGGWWLFGPGAYYLIRLPISGSFGSLNWADYITRFQDYGYFTGNTDRRYTNRVSIIPDVVTGKIGLLSYLSQSEITLGTPGTTLTTPGSEYWVVDPAAHTVVQPITSVQASWGQPWVDAGKLLDDVTVSTPTDDYTAPTVNIITGGYEVIFGRTVSNDATKGRLRRFFVDGITGEIFAVDVTDFTVATDWADGMVFSPRDGSDLLVASTNAENWHFFQIALPLIETPAEIGGTYWFIDDIIPIKAFRVYLPKKPLNSVLEIGPMLFEDQKEADETSLISSLVIGLSEAGNDPVKFIDYASNDSGDEDWNNIGAPEDVYDDWMDGYGDPDNFDLRLTAMADGLTPVFNGAEDLTVVDNLGSSLGYGPEGRSGIMHKLRFNAGAVGQRFALKFIEMAGMLTGRLWH